MLSHTFPGACLVPRRTTPLRFGGRRPCRPHPRRGDRGRPRRHGARPRPHRAGRPPAVRGRRSGPRRPLGAGRHRERPRGRGPRGGARLAARPRHGRALPQLGDPAARAAQPAQRHRRSAARGAPQACPPRFAPRPAPGRRCPGPVGAAAAGEGARRPRARRAGGRPDGAHGGRRAAARRCGVLPRRPGRAAGRVRRPGRHRRRLPAHRGAPAAGGVLGRRRRGDPQLLGGRPAHAREGGSAVGATVPRAIADRRRAQARVGARRAAPAAGRAHRQDRCRHRRRGHGGPDPCARRRDGAAGRSAAGPDPRAGPRPRAGPAPCPRPGRDQRGVPRRELGGRGQRWRVADRPRRRVVPRPGGRPRPLARRRSELVDGQPVRAGRRHRGSAPGRR